MIPPRRSIYLAGPDVFFLDPLAAADAKKQICAAAGLHGVFPLDPLPDEPADWAALPAAQLIARRNEAHIRRCDAVIANLTPFRGPSADAGTVYEVGFARGLGKPVYAYSNDTRFYEARVRGLLAQPHAEQDAVRDRDGLEIEGFGLSDNLMIAMGVEECGAPVVCVPCAADTMWTDLAGFTCCVALAAVQLPSAQG